MWISNDEGTHWTKLVIKGMARCGRRTIINMSYGSANHMMLLLSEHDKAKLFLEHFLESLGPKYRGGAVPGAIMRHEQAGKDEG